MRCSITLAVRECVPRRKGTMARCSRVLLAPNVAVCVHLMHITLNTIFGYWNKRPQKETRFTRQENSANRNYQNKLPGGSAFATATKANKTATNVANTLKLIALLILFFWFEN